MINNKVFTETREFLAAAFEVVPNEDDEPLSRDELLRRARAAHGLLAFMPDAVDDSFLAACPQLRVIACALKGADNFDVEACARRGVWLTIVPDLLTEPTAELALGLAIGLGRHILAADQAVRAVGFRGWRPRLYGTSLDGSTVAILGAGRVGCAIARKLAGFSCSVLMVDRREAVLPHNPRRAALDD